MTLFLYDRTFDGMLTAVFDAFARKACPDALAGKDGQLPLFCEETYTVVTDEAKAQRVWKALQKKLTPSALSCLTVSFLSELPELDMPLFRYLCKAAKAPRSIETNFADEDVRTVTGIYRKVLSERLRMLQFVRFQKAADGTYFALIEPMYNVLPLAVGHFKDRFADQPFLLYDKRRDCGYYYDKESLTPVSFADKLPHFLTGKLAPERMAGDEKLFQELWRTYFKAVCIEERRNPRKQRKDMPVRYWKYLTEKNG